MNQSGDAAEQIVRMSLEGVEVAARITGSAAKEIATFLVAALKSSGNKLKLKGKARMASMLKSNKALEIFSIKERDLAKFAQGAKQYGIVYCVLRNRKNAPDGLCDVMVKADDAPKISRVVERFKFATVDKAKIESEIVKAKGEKTKDIEPDAPDKNDTEKLLDNLLGTDEGKTAPATPKSAKIDTPQKNPDSARTTKARPSEPIFESRSKSARGTLNDKPSVREEIREIKAEQSKKEVDAPKRNERQNSDKTNSHAAATHKQPYNNGKKSKSKKSKERS